MLKWVSTVESETFEGDPVEAINGLLSDINVDSVALGRRRPICISLSINAEAIISFDKHFDGLRMPRIEPH